MECSCHPIFLAFELWSRPTCMDDHHTGSIRFIACDIVLDKLMKCNHENFFLLLIHGFHKMWNCWMIIVQDLFVWVHPEVTFFSIFSAWGAERCGATMPGYFKIVNICISYCIWYSGKSSLTSICKCSPALCGPLVSTFHQCSPLIVFSTRGLASR